MSCFISPALRRALVSSCIGSVVLSASPVLAQQVAAPFADAPRQAAAAEAAVNDIPAVQQVVRETGALRLSVHGAPTAVTRVVSAATEAGMTLTDVQIQRPDLESVFLHLTGKALRD